MKDTVKLIQDVSIAIVEKKGPDDTSVKTLAQALGVDIKLFGYKWKIDGELYSLEQAHAYLIELWKLRENQM